MHPLSLPILLQGDFERLSSGAPVCHVVTIEHFGGVEEMEKAVFGAPPHSSKYTQQIIKAACHSPSLFPAVAAGNSRFPGWLCSSEPICAHRADVHPNGHVNTRSGAMAGVLEYLGATQIDTLASRLMWGVPGPVRALVHFWKQNISSGMF